ncbi:hypothetical protein AVEN_186561-1 [Araneus ventricosus]|uniref:Uncharacterized protein n=1 Tax=Araneus ventricosus TaxID=182803 RepID=A0A4Y2W686_ARAVE|nr:hypothetical protein AVEN_186561-1 [Araneus ventricosus]
MICPKHHESIKDDETGQYVGSNTSDFKIVSPKNSSKIRPVKPKSPIEKANMYQNLMDLEDQGMENCPPEVSTPTINSIDTGTSHSSLQAKYGGRPNITIKFPPPFVKWIDFTPAPRAFFVRVARPERFG